MDISTMAPRSRARTIGIAAVATNLAIWVAYLLTSDDPRDRSADDWIFLAVLTVVLAVIWRLMVVGPVARTEGNTPAKVGMIAGIVGVLANALFWTGLPLILGAGALALGFDGRRRATRGAGRAGMAQAAMILGAVAIVSWAALLIFGD